jgi:serine/threonine protein kinase/Tol biopolymer transport system component
MGQVFRSRDTRLGRDVAIKVLPDRLLGRQDLRDRFEMEARAVAALNHPNIRALYDIGCVDDVDFLVLEFLEGETLEARLEKGNLPLEQVIRYALQIADALRGAHSAGITHRDLKPSNIMLTKAGAKLMDFGLAKVELTQTDDGVNTLSTRLTTEGTVLGTIQYMSPEQLQGNPTDARTDIFAFGAVLYEMLSGKRAFAAASRVNLIVSILEQEPEPIATLRPETPRTLEMLIAGCLAKSRDDRWQAMQDVYRQLEWIDSAVSPEPDRGQSVRRRGVFAAVGILGVLLGVLLSALALPFRGTTAITKDVTYSSIFAPNQPLQWPAPAISPDGTQVAFVGAEQDGPKMLWIRSFQSPAARALPGTTNATGSFWSPDGKSLGFFADGRLKRVDLAGGTPIDLAEAPNQRGGTWSNQGFILFGPAPGIGLVRVSASGGPLTVVRKPNGEETLLSYPSFLPDGRHYLYSVRNGSGTFQVFAGDVESASTKFILEGASRAEFATGYLFFGRTRNLLAQPFNTDRLELSGEAVRITDNVGGTRGITTDYAFSVSSAGTLVSWSGGVLPLSQSTWITRIGQKLGTVWEPGHYFGFDMAPSEDRIAVERIDAQTDLTDIWTVDLKSGLAGRLTEATPKNSQFGTPIWSAAGREIVYRNPQDLYLKPAQGGTQQALAFGPNNTWLTDWSRDGRFIVYGDEDIDTGADLCVFPLFGDRHSYHYLQTRSAEYGARFSPGDQWLAYVSTDTGREEVYVDSFPKSGRRVRISTGGGSEPEWRKDGKELYYLAPDGYLMVVEISKNGQDLKPSVPKILFPAPRVIHDGRHQYVPTGSGERFLFNAILENSTPQTIEVVHNWPALLKKQ